MAQSNLAESKMIEGLIVNKVGEVRVKTKGKIATVCGNDLGYDSPRTKQKVILLCSYTSNISAGPGDSGSPVFQCWDSNKKQVPCAKGSTNQDVRILGILWGGEAVLAQSDSSTKRKKRVSKMWPMNWAP